MSTNHTSPAPVRAAPFRVVFGSVLLAAFYSVMGVYVPYIIAPILILTMTVILLPLGYANAARSFLVRIVTALTGAILGVLMLWAVWYGLEFGWAALTDLAKLTPQQIFGRIVSLSDQIVYTTTGDVGDLTHGTRFTKVIWLTETAIFGLTPILGALAGPRGHAMFHRKSARYEASRNR